VPWCAFKKYSPERVSKLRPNSAIGIAFHPRNVDCLPEPASINRIPFFVFKNRLCQFSTIEYSLQRPPLALSRNVFQVPHKETFYLNRYSPLVPPASVKERRGKKGLLSSLYGKPSSETVSTGVALERGND
jgi:hypothetical protein